MHNSLWSNFHDGGWAMWLIFAFGLTAVGAAGRFAWRGEHQLTAFIRWMLGLELASGGFGFFAGMQKVFWYAGERLPEAPATDGSALPERQLRILLEGSKEALNCINGALMFVVLICLLAAIGHRRFPLPNPAAVPR